MGQRLLPITSKFDLESDHLIRRGSIYPMTSFLRTYGKHINSAQLDQTSSLYILAHSSAIFQFNDGRN